MDTQCFWSDQLFLQHCEEVADVAPSDPNKKLAGLENGDRQTTHLLQHASRLAKLLAVRRQHHSLYNVDSQARRTELTRSAMWFWLASRAATPNHVNCLVANKPN